MSGSLNQFIHSFSIDTESQQTNVEKSWKCFRIFGYILLAIGIFVVPYAISKIEISSFKTDVQNMQDQLKTLKTVVETKLDMKLTSKPATNLTKKISDLESLIQDVDNRTASFFNYKVVQGTKSAFLKMTEKMNFEVRKLSWLTLKHGYDLSIIQDSVTNGLFYTWFQNGKKACEKGYGHIVEFDDNMTQDDFANFIENIIQAFELRTQDYFAGIGNEDFYLGLTDREKEDQWKWESSGRIFNMTQSREKWAENEPNGHKSEDCTVLLINDNSPYSYEENKYPKMNDVNCDTKFTIICQRKISV